MNNVRNLFICCNISGIDWICNGWRDDRIKMELIDENKKIHRGGILVRCRNCNLWIDTMSIYTIKDEDGKYRHERCPI